jgi:hypothetical protein
MLQTFHRGPETEPRKPCDVQPQYYRHWHEGRDGRKTQKDFENKRNRPLNMEYDPQQLSFRSY